MAHQQIDTFATDLSPEVQEAVHANSAAGTEKRFDVLATDFGDPNPLRKLAGAIKQHTIENLDQYLAQAETQLAKHGVKTVVMVGTGHFLMIENPARFNPILISAIEEIRK